MQQDLQTGLYEQVLTRKVAEAIDGLESVQSRISKLSSGEGHLLLNRHVSNLVQAALLYYGGTDRLHRQLRFINRIVDVLAEELPELFSKRDHATENLLEELFATRLAGLVAPVPVPRPSIPLSSSALLVNAPKEYRIGWELRREIASADRIDLLCSFVKWSGLRLLESNLKDFLDSGKQLRVITTVYMGATERRALDHLVSLGADVKVSYDTRRTRLHAKAWLLHRATGFTTAYIGSSNLSEAAQLNGLEWNVRVSAVDAPQIVHKFEATFATYWEDPEFRTYSAKAEERRAMDQVLDRERSPQDADTFALVDIHPFPFQQEILERLTVERSVHRRTKNLIVAATGTGKTVVAALDYRRLRKDDGLNELLFVAHRKEILKQSRAVFRLVLKDRDFGELFVEGRRPVRGSHVFASVQSLSHLNLAEMDPEAFDVVIIDEFHHAAAPTYDQLLRHFRPKILLGLTATPERADGRSILHWFGNHTAAELRLWDAINLRLLAPFHYFGIHDHMDLSRVGWVRGRYNQQELTALYEANQRRADLIIEAVHENVAEVARMRALGFCVGVAHARFMADRFNMAGIPSLAITGETPRDQRSDAVRKLRERKVAVLFTVDLFSEGVDIPEVDTVLFLRPTESTTVFLQQLGRGLRRHEEKECLTVLDFIGAAHSKFRFDVRFRALLNATRLEVEHQIEAGFPILPSGCAIQLDRQSQEAVLRNVRQALSTSTSGLVSELRRLGPRTTLAQFLRECGLERHELYRGSRTFTNLRRAAGFDVEPQGSQEVQLGRAFGRLLHIDEPARLHLYATALESGFDPQALSEHSRRRLMMLLCVLFGPAAAGRLGAYHAELVQHPALCQELGELLFVLREEVRHAPRHAELPADVPLALHCSYSREEIMAAFGHVRSNGNLVQPREGVVYHAPTRSNLLFVTLEKIEKDYSPTTMYKDYAISARRFHWQSQSRTSAASTKGRRHTDHQGQDITPLLFVRTRKRENGRTKPYLFLGPLMYVRHDGDRPMSILWHLPTPMPADFLRVARVAA